VKKDLQERSVLLIQTAAGNNSTSLKRIPPVGGIFFI
jgi:hypothetical protein